MAMTTERGNLLATYLAADEARAKALFEMSAEEAVAKINADGYDFTVEDLQEFAAKIANLAESTDGELSEDALDDVSGGAIIVSIVKLYHKLGVILIIWVRRLLKK